MVLSFLNRNSDTKIHKKPEDFHATENGVTSSIVNVNGLSVAYHRKIVLEDISFNLSPKLGDDKGELLAIIGPNGAGKSTLIKSLLGLIPTITGKVEFFNTPLKKQRQRVAYVPQRSTVDWDFPASALDVVTMGLYGKIGLFAPIRSRHKKEAMGYLSQVGLEDFANRQIGQLSGGQQQRVFIARALAQQADLYFMDEPFAGVDVATEKAIMHLLHSLKKAGKTVICVHHDLETVPDYFDSAILINKKLIAYGKMSEVFTAQNLETTYGGKLATTHLTNITKG